MNSKKDSKDSKDTKAQPKTTTTENKAWALIVYSLILLYSSKFN